MILYGKEIILRSIEEEDAELLREMINSPELESYVIGYSFPVSRKAQSIWMDQLADCRDTFRAIIDVDGVGIGEVMLTDIDYKNGNAEIHIKIADKKYRGHGYGKDAINTVVNYAFDELRLHCIYCQIREDNIASQKMFEHCDFNYEGLLQSRMFKSGHYYGIKSYSKINGFNGRQKCL